MQWLGPTAPRMVPSLSQQLQLQHRRQRLRGTPGSWRVSSELPVSLQTMAAAAEAAAAAAAAAAAIQPIQLPAPVLAEPSLPAAVCETPLSPLERPPTLTGLAHAQAPVLAAPGRLQSQPRAEAVALVVWLLLVLIDGGLSLGRLLRRPDGAAGCWPAPGRRRRAGGGSCGPSGSAPAPLRPGSFPPLVRAMAADQPAVAIS